MLKQKRVKKCRSCREEFKPHSSTQRACSISCAIAIAKADEKKAFDRETRERKQAFDRETRRRKEQLLTRNQLFSRLQKLVNQYVVHVRDKHEPCFTCGTQNPNIVYAAGHRYHAGRGGADRRRFVLENIHKQCNVVCNNHGSGIPAEYDRALAEKYGEDFPGYLSCESNYPTLKEQFPTKEDIKREIARYRKVLRENSLRPAV